MKLTRRGAFILGTLFTVAIISLLSLNVFFAPTTSAASWIFSPAKISGTPNVGQTLQVTVSYQAPQGTSGSFLLDTEIYLTNGGRVAQFVETLPFGSSQTIARSYSWQTGGLATGTYVVKQGVFNPNWAGLVTWNDNSGIVALTNGSSPAPTATSVVNPTPTATPKPTATPIPTATPVPATTSASATWQQSARLQSSPVNAGQNNAILATYGVVNSGSYILDLELYSGGTRVQQWFDTRTVNAGSPQTLTWAWQPNASGNFTVKMGIFNTSWQNLIWNDNVLSFSVNSSTSTPSATPTATPAPTINPAPVSTGSYMRGVNLAGAEFGEGSLPGTYGSTYTYPTASELDYYKSKGLNLIRLPFRWERLQQSLYGSLDATELGRIDTVVAAARARGMKVILDPHNYARYTINGQQYLIGSAQVPANAFADFWTKLAAHYNGESAIYAYSLMNEPHDTNGTWKASAQAGLNGIRQADSGHMVLVPGDSWSGAWTWTQYNNDLVLSDPSNNLMYEAHQYFDQNGSGTYGSSYDANGAYPNIGVDRVQPFITWLKSKGLRGIVTEYGVPNDDPRWLTVLDNFLAKLDSEGIGGTYWAGGPWWGSYALSSEPANGQDKPVMSVLTRHLSK
ncbi:MAG TPA: glycoside hydrolase family 5 protein [Chloroflexia bacterium]|nr:glycoside hydrolase family 5 protein [Chloroflexia bacterium]